VKYGMYTPVATGAAYAALDILLVVFVLAGGLGIYYGNRRLSVCIGMLATLGVCVLSVVAQHRFLGTLYVIDRGALFLYPLFVLALALCLRTVPAPRIMAAVFLLLAAAFGAN